MAAYVAPTSARSGIKLPQHIDPNSLTGQADRGNPSQRPAFVNADPIVRQCGQERWHLNKDELFGGWSQRFRRAAPSCRCSLAVDRASVLAAGFPGPSAARLSTAHGPAPFSM